MVQRGFFEEGKHYTVKIGSASTLVNMLDSAVVPYTFVFYAAPTPISQLVFTHDSSTTIDNPVVDDKQNWGSLMQQVLLLLQHVCNTHTHNCC